MIYQLAKTSVGLTGQVKWDVVVNNKAVSELHIVPIHKNIPYIHRRKNDVTNYSHIQNLKKLYSETSSTFFQPVIDPILNTGYPVRNNGDWIDTCENSYNMHLGRANYQRYGKQFEFFCPVWVDSKEDISNIDFKIVLSTFSEAHINTIKTGEYAYGPWQNKTFTYTKTIYIHTDETKYYKFIKPNNVSIFVPVDKITDENITADDIYTWSTGSSSEAHDGEGNFVKMSSNIVGSPTNIDEVTVTPIVENNLYTQTINLDNKINGKKSFRDYLIEYANDVNLNENLTYININKNNSWIKGVDVKSGVLRTKNTPSLIDNITSIERPVMETDNLILSQFADNNMICTQLINFNFIFNIEDLLPISLYTQLVGEQLNMYVDVYNKNGESITKVDLKDLYSNYDFIPRYDNKNYSFTDNNCLNYLNDHHAIDLILKNKQVQSTFHWALYSKPDYMFNLYDGFCPVYVDENDQVFIKGIYNDTPVVSDDRFDEKHNPYNWCTLNDIGDISIQQEDESDTLQNFAYEKMRRRINGIPLNKMSHINLSDKNQEYFWINSLLVKYDKKLSNSTIKDVYITRVVYTNSGGATLEWDAAFRAENNQYVLKTTDITDPIEIHLVVTYKNDTLYVYIISKNYLNLTQEYSLFDIKQHGIVVSNDPIQGQPLKYFFETTLKDVLDNAVNPTIIYFNKSIVGIEADRPQVTVLSDNSSSREIEYIKKEKDVYIQRYDGNIYPYFNDPNNIDLVFNNIYWVKQYDRQINYVGTTDNPAKSDEGMTKFNEMLYSKYLPIYPSINYSSLLSDKLDINKYYHIDKQLSEYSWYKHNNLRFLPEQIYIVKDIDITEEEFSDEIVFNELFEKFKELNIFADEEKEFYKYHIYPLYKYTYKAEYKNLTTTTEYIYTINVFLK